ncbi:MAG: type transport system permease protein [Thermoleophilaceae bacterium]|nr:type transport system permease protein [Thermoleophilaceae bacterium]
MSVDPVDLGALGRPIKGPSALGGDGRRFFHLVWTLAVTEFKLRFFGSVLGYFWQLVRPLMLFGVLLLVFTQFVRLGPGTPDYAVVLLTDIVIFTFFADATGGCVSSLVDRENLVRKIQFPRMVVPLAVVLNAYFNLLLNIVVVFVFATIGSSSYAKDFTPRLSWLELPVLLLFLGVFVVGIGMLLSALYVRFRDMRPIWEVVSQALFYASPVIYPIEKIPEKALQPYVMANPLSTVLTQIRHAIIDPNAPNAADAIGGSGRLAIPAGIVVGVFVLGFWLFNREAPRIAEQL